MPPSLYACPCCGYKTLDMEPPGSYSICPICFWEDDGNYLGEHPVNWTRSNDVGLKQAQRNFLELGACERQWLGSVRAPTAADERDPEWQTLDQQIDQGRSPLIARVQAAFEAVTLGDGVSLHQARALDDYQDPLMARQIDGHVPWQDIPDDWLEQFHDVFFFLDFPGFRHAIPAYMLWCLKYMRWGTNTFGFLYDYLQHERYQQEFAAQMDLDQQTVIADFIQWIALVLCS